MAAQTNFPTERSEAELKSLLAAKEEMLDFYRKEQLRRKERFQKEMASR